MKKLLVALILACIAITIICMNAGCRTVKRNKSIHRNDVDSFIKKAQTSSKETVIYEFASKPLVVNPGNLFGTLPADAFKGPIVLENEHYKVTVTPPMQGKGGSVDVKGKNKTINVPIEKTTVINEHSDAKEEVDVRKKSSDTTVDKKSSGIPFVSGIVIIGSILVLIALYLLFTKKINLPIP